MRKLCLAVILVCSLAACSDTGPARRYNDDDYVTGSNLPRRGSMPSEAQTVSKETVDDWQRVRPGQKAPGMGF